MATTKRAQYRFVIKEGPELTREPREGVIEMNYPPFIVAEPCDRTPVKDRPLQDDDLLSFELREGISLDEAQTISDFLNDHLRYVAITRFGDAKDAARDVKQSERVQGIELERLSMVTTMLKEKLAANDVPGAVDDLQAVESVIGKLVAEWSKALATSREILDAFGKDEGHDA